MTVERLVRATCAALFVAALSGCGGGGAARTGLKTLTIAQQREPGALNPALENGQSAMEWGLLLFSYLVKFDDHGRLIGDIATEVPSLRNGGISKDGLTVTYHLRSGVRFADGKLLTAHDCVWTIGAINNTDNNVQSRYGYDRVVRADAPNDSTLVVHLRRPFAPLLTLLMAPQGFPILPQHVLSGFHDFNRIAFNALPLGSGPFVVTRWARGDRVEMRPNPYYWQGKSKIDRLVVRFVADTQTGISLLKTHEVDGYFDEQDFADYPILQAIPGYTVSRTPIDGVGAIIFNTQSPLTSDARVRHALAMAIDVKRLVRSAYRGAIDPSNAGRGLFIWAYDPKAFPDIPFDPAASRALLEAAGWKAGADGVRRHDGRALDLVMVIQAGTPGDAIIGNTVAQEEREIGARVTLKAFNITQFVAPVGEGGPVYGGKFDLALYPFTNGDDPDTTDQFACANVPPHGYNKSRICDPRIDALLAAGQSSFDPAKRMAAYGNLQRILAEELPLVMTFQRRQINTFSARVQGQSTSLSGAFWNAGAWSLK